MIYILSIQCYLSSSAALSEPGKSPPQFWHRHCNEYIIIEWTKYFDVCLLEDALIGVFCVVHACITVSVSKLRNSSKLVNTASHPVWRCCRARWLGPGSRIYRCRGGGCCGGRCLRSRRTWWSSWCRPCASPTPWSGVSASPVSTWQTSHCNECTDKAEKDNHFLIQTENVNVHANHHAIVHCY